MRTVLILVVAIGLSACVSETQRQAAALQCQSVGVTQSDPYFDTCVQSYALQANQAQLDDAYRLTLNPTYEKRGLAHQWHGF